VTGLAVPSVLIVSGGKALAGAEHFGSILDAAPRERAVHDAAFGHENIPCGRPWSSLLPFGWPASVRLSPEQHICLPSNARARRTPEPLEMLTFRLNWEGNFGALEAQAKSSLVGLLIHIGLQLHARLRGAPTADKADARLG
jgi:hypothetical protein